MSEWHVIQSPTDAEMSAVQGVYLVADNLPIEDANLIAAAPDLLEALEIAEVTMRLDGERLRSLGRTDFQSSHAVETARLALAKAKGER